MWRYPPGHGDVFPSLMNSGKLDALLSQVSSWNRCWCCMFYLPMLTCIYFDYTSITSSVCFLCSGQGVCFYCKLRQFGCNSRLKYPCLCLCRHNNWLIGVSYFFPCSFIFFLIYTLVRIKFQWFSYGWVLLDKWNRNPQSLDTKPEWILYGGTQIWPNLSVMLYCSTLNSCPNPDILCR